MILSDIEKYRFLFDKYHYPMPVCNDFTSLDLSVVSDNYDFANSAPFHVCSSDTRLAGVKSQRKIQPYPCIAMHSFSSCPYFKPALSLVKTSSFAQKTFELLKMSCYDPQEGKFRQKYFVCSAEKEVCYFDYYSDLEDDQSEAVFDNFVREAADKEHFVIEKVEQKSEEQSTKKVSYFSRLIKTLVTS